MAADELAAKRAEQAVMDLIDHIMLGLEADSDFRTHMSNAYINDGVTLTCEQLAEVAGELIGQTISYLLNNDGYLERCRDL